MIGPNSLTTQNDKTKKDIMKKKKKETVPSLSSLCLSPSQPFLFSQRPFKSFLTHEDHHHHLPPPSSSSSSLLKNKLDQVFAYVRSSYLFFLSYCLITLCFVFQFQSYFLICLVICDLNLGILKSKN